MLTRRESKCFVYLEWYF